FNKVAVDAHGIRVSRDELQQEVLRLTSERDNVEQRRAAEVLASFQKVRQIEAEHRRLAALVESRETEIAAFRNSKTFRYTANLRRLYGMLRRRAPEPQVVPALPAFPPDGSYQTWIDLYDTLDDVARRQIATRAHAMAEQLKISVIMPVYNPPPAYLRAAVDSVRNQIYPNWELCIADDASTETEIRALLDSYAASDPRIKLVRREENGHISAASNSALAMATGGWVVCLDHDDVLAEHALAFVALCVSDQPEAGIVYSDEDKVDESGQRREPYFKPDFDPLLLLGQNYFNHLTALRRDLVDAVGGYREGYEGSQDWDLVLRVTEMLEPEQVRHIPRVLYHWRVHGQSTASVISAKPYAMEAGRRAAVDHLERTGRSASVMRVGMSGHNRISWTIPDPAPKVTIVIPTKDGRLIRECIDSVLTLTTYTNYEMVVVDNFSRNFETLEYLRAYDDRLTVLRYEHPFNYAAINNYAVEHSSGDVVCLLNDDTEVISGEWLSEMVAQLLQPGVGAVGAKLDYDDGRVQHAGVVLGIGGVAGHANRMENRLSSGYFGNLQVARRMSAVTAACMVVRRDAWEQVGGFDVVNLPVAFNDVDLCLRLGESGWSIVWTPYAELLHHESITRGPDTGPRADGFASEIAYMQTRWGEGLTEDPYYNPNLTFDAENYTLAWPPRTAGLSDS
ncbi:MAG TPA: glycosyltransferase family 2 protein, partial [Acidimicrobiales bacterium]|nr:glycosyltransferase family 2 protein [Acidimicrobiales bacterium]